MNTRVIGIFLLLLLVSVAWWASKSTPVQLAAPAQPGTTASGSERTGPATPGPVASVEHPRAAAAVAPVSETAESMAPEQDAEEDGLAELRGTVHLPGGAPAAGAEISVEGWEANEERTLQFGLPQSWEDLIGTVSRDGSFSLRFDPPRAFQFVLSIKAQGFGEATWRWSELAPRSVTDVGRIVLRDAGVIEGRIVDASGAARPGEWSVHAESSVSTPGPDGDQARVFARVDPLSATFRLEDVPIGRVELSAYSQLTNWVDGPIVVVEKDRILEADIVYRGPDRSRSIAVSTSTSPFHIFGHGEEGTIAVVGRDGHRRAAKKIPGSSSTWSVEDLEDDSYTVMIEDPNFEPWSQAGVRPGESVSADLRPSAGVALSVVDDATSRPLETYRLRTQFRFSNGTRISPDTFEVRGANEPLPPGPVYRGMMPHDQTLLVDAPGYALGQVDVSELRPGEIRAVEVRLTAALQLAGRVTRDGSPVLGATVLLGPAGLERVADPFGDEEDSLARQRQETETDAQGRFEFTGIVPGTFWVEANQGPLHSAYLDGIEVASGAAGDLLLELPATGSLTGRLLVPDAVSVDGLSVRAWPQPSPELGWLGSIAELAPNGAVAADGSFLIEELPAGDLLVSVVAGQSEEVQQGSMSYVTGPPVRSLGLVTIRPGEVTKADFDLGGHVPCALRVAVTVNGEPADDFGVVADEVPSNVVGQPSRLQRRTDAFGRFELSPIFPGSFRLMVTPPEGGWSFKPAEPLEARPGGLGEVAVDIQVVEAEFTVLEAGTGQPLGGHSVHLSPSRGGLVARGTSDDQGLVRMRLPVGTYRATDAGNAKGQFMPADAGVPVDWTQQGPVPASIELVKAKPFEFPSKD